MKREEIIKFRGKSEGKWYYFTIWETHKLPLIEPKTVSQWTGLTNKNGVRIYEGDVVASRNYLSKLGMPMEVRYCINRTFRADEYGITITGFYLMGNKDDDFYRAITSEYEVIGNIFENPELVKESKDMKKYIYCSACHLRKKIKEEGKDGIFTDAHYVWCPKYRYEHKKWYQF